MKEKTLSIFIDESGDFGTYESHAPFYLVSMVFHDQGIDIQENIRGLDQHLYNLGYPQHTIHTGPIIRRESVYSNDLRENRKRLFNALFHFSRKLNIQYACAVIKKAECEDIVTLTAKLSRSIADILIRNQDYLRSFDKIIVYYDNGQVELTKVLTSVINALFTHVEFRKVKPADYKLFQVADLICTMELLSQKVEGNLLSQSEIDFFSSGRDFKKNYLKSLRAKRI